MRTVVVFNSSDDNDDDGDDDGDGNSDCLRLL